MSKIVLFEVSQIFLPVVEQGVRGQIDIPIRISCGIFEEKFSVVIKLVSFKQCGLRVVRSFELDGRINQLVVTELKNLVGVE